LPVIQGAYRQYTHQVDYEDLQHPQTIDTWPPGGTDTPLEAFAFCIQPRLSLNLYCWTVNLTGRISIGLFLISK